MRFAFFDNRPWWFYVCAVLYAAFFLFFAAHAYLHPMKNWDMVAYIAVVESYTQSDPQQIYDATMQEVGDHAADRYNYVEHVLLSQDTRALYEQLPFYRIRPLYTGTMFLLHQCGMSLVMTTYVLSIAGFMAIGVLCFFIIPKTMPPPLWWALIVVSSLTWPMPLTRLATMSTPDTLCVAFCISGFASWVYRRSAIGYGICMLLAELTRSEIMVMTQILTLFFAFLAPAPYRMLHKPAFAIMVAAALMYFGVNHLSGYYGWRLHFYYDFLSRTPYPAEAVPKFDVSDYLHNVIKGLVYMTRSAHMRGLFLLTSVASACHYIKPQVKPVFLYLLYVLWLSMFLRYLPMPGREERYFYPWYFLMFYCALEVIAPYARGAIAAYGSQRKAKTPAESA